MFKDMEELTVGDFSDMDRGAIAFILTQSKRKRPCASENERTVRELEYKLHNQKQ